MAQLEVRTIGDPVLEKKAVEVDAVDDALRRLLDDMVETMYAEEGIGLAAPQVGHSVRAVVVQVGAPIYKMVNPVITVREGRSKGMEACLSVPDLDGEVERANAITVEYLDETGAAKRLEATGLLARCIQHECDHLDGVLFVTRVSPSRRIMLKKKLGELRRETKARLQASGVGR